MKSSILFVFALTIANYQFVNSQFTSQILQQLIANSNRPAEVIDNIAYPSATINPNCPIEFFDNVIYQSPNVIVESPCSMTPPPAPQLPVPGNTILITDCSPSACQNLADTLQLMIVCNLLQNTQGGKDYALQLAAPVIKQLISSPTFSCGCPNPVYANIAASNAVCPNIVPQTIVSPNIPSNFISAGQVRDTNLISISNSLPVSSCSCQTCSGAVSSCPCQACSPPVPTCSCQSLQGPVSLYTCQQCSASVPSCPCQACSSSAPPSPCQKCLAPAPSCSCQKCSAPASTCPAPVALQPSPPCQCQACTACPNNLNSILSSFLNFL